MAPEGRNLSLISQVSPRAARRFTWRFPRRWGFAPRLALATSVLIVCTCVVLSWMLVQNNLEDIRGRLVERGQITAKYLASNAELSILSSDTASLRQITQSTRNQGDVAYCRFFDRHGQVLAAAGGPPTTYAPVFNEPLPEVRGPIAVDAGVWEFQAPIFATIQSHEEPAPALAEAAPGAHPPTRQFIGSVALGMSTAPLEATRKKVWTTAGIFTMLVTFAGIVLAALFATAITRPLEELAGATKEIAKGNLNTIVAIRTHDEVGALAASFNAMVQSVARNRAEFAEHSRTLEEKVAARTERLEALNRELQEANRLKSEFLTTISHELRTPLNVILGYCEMLTDGAAGSLSQEQADLIDAVYRYSRLQLDLVTNVLDFSRLTSGKVSLHVERFALAPLLADIQSLYKYRLSQSNVHFALSVSPALPELETDRIKVQEIVRNLIDNAVKFTETGSISVSAHADTTPHWMVIEVADTGPGIAADDLPYIFDAFRQAGQVTTRQATGFGLGLSIVKQLVDALCGTIAVTSKPGEGSTFRVELPCQVPSSETDGPIKAVASAS